MPKAEYNTIKIDFFRFKSMPSAMNTLPPFSDVASSEENDSCY